MGKTGEVVVTKPTHDHVLAATEATPSNAAVVEGPNIRADANGVVRLLQPDGRWAALEWLAVDGVAHLVPSLDDITDEAPPIRGAAQAEFIRSKLAAMDETDRPRGDELGELHDDLVGTEYQASLDPHMAGFGRDDLWRAVWARWRAKSAVTIAVRNVVDAVTVDALPEKEPGKKRPKKTEKKDLVLVTPPEVPKATEALTADMGRHWPSVLAKLGPLDAEPADLDRRAKDALLALGGDANDALAAEGAEKAGRLKPIAWPDPVPLARQVAQALWTVETGPRIKVDRHNPAGVSVPLLTHYINISQRGAQRSLLGEKDTIFSRGGGQLATIDHGSAEIDARLVSHKALGTLVAQKVVRWLVNEAHRQKFVLGLESPDRVSIVGGYAALAAMLGLDSSAAAVQALRETIETFHVLEMSSEFWRGRLVSRGLIPSAPGRRSVLDLKVHGPFEPGFAQRLKPSEARAFAPMPLPRLLPAFVGRENEWAAQANLHLLWFRELRVRAREFAEAGCTLTITDRQWAALADEAEVPKATLPDVRKAFATGNKTSPPFLIPEGDVFRLGKAYDVEERSIAYAGGLSSEGRAGGLASAQRRRRRQR